MKSAAFVAFLLSLASVCWCNCDPDEHRNLVELIEARGFKVEVHFVTTNDGYILALHHLVNRNSSCVECIELKPVILQHGLVGSAADFVVNSPYVLNNNSKYGDNIGFSILLTNRYDVWMANSRGNKYSRGHVRYDSSDRRYWNFAFDQMATKDLPAVIDYVRNITHSKTVGYVGYSQGTATMFALLSLKPEYADIVQPFIALAPVAFVEHITSPIRFFAPTASILRFVGGEFLLSDQLTNTLADLFCQMKLKLLCTNFVFLIGGSDFRHFNMTRIGVYLHFTPSSTSTWDVTQFAQLVNSHRFSRFDYGSQSKNRQAYGVDFVPDYPLQNISSNAKIALFQGLNDVLADQKDIAHLRTVLTEQAKVRLIEDYTIPSPKWTHLDFIYGIDSGKLFIDRLIEVLDQYS